MLGYTAAELAAMKLQEYTHADDLEENLQLFQRDHGRATAGLPVREALLPQRRRGDLGPRHLCRRGATPTASATTRSRCSRTSPSASSPNRPSTNKPSSTSITRLHDALTGLANRRKLYTDVERALSEPDAPSFALGLFDLDGFKAYNDAFGHPAGDALLAHLGHRIADAIGDKGTAYRMGGDEFCVFTWATDSERVLEAARMALCDKGEGFAIRCSSGVAFVPTEADDLERAIQSPTKGCTRTSAPTEPARSRCATRSYS